MSSKTKWLVGIALILVVVLIAPFVMLLVNHKQVGALLVVSHYQSLILGVLTVAIAIVALNTYLGIEERVDQRISKVTEEIKKTNKEYLSVMAVLQESKADPSKFESIVGTTVRDADVYRFFEEDIKQVFYGLNERPGRVTRATGVYLADFLRDNPAFDKDRRWRFYVNVVAQTTSSWACARSEVSFLQEIDKAWLDNGGLMWLFSLWQPERADDWKAVLRKFVLDISIHFQTSRDVADTTRAIIQRQYPANDASLWNSPKDGPSGYLVWLVYNRKSESLETWSVSFEDLYCGTSGEEVLLPELDASVSVRDQALEEFEVRNPGRTMMEDIDFRKERLIIICSQPWIDLAKRFVYGLVVVQRRRMDSLNGIVYNLGGLVQSIDEELSVKVIAATEDPNTVGA